VKSVYPHFGIILCCWFFGTTQVHSQDVEKISSNYESFFIEGALYYNFPSGLFSGIIKPLPGFRGALGYEWQRLKFSLSSGYNKSSGADPLVVDTVFIPMTVRIGYMIPLKKNWGIEADLGMGLQYSKTLHYETLLDFLADRQEKSIEIKPFAEGRLFIYIRPLDFLKIYAGGGVDVIFEVKKPIPLPALEVGLSFKPLAIGPPKKRKPKVFIDDEEVIIPAIPWKETIYFEADSGTIILPQYQHLLEEAGKRLKENPQAYITLWGYAAPAGTTDGQITVSAARVWYCVEYLKKKYSIREERMYLKFFGAEEISTEMKKAVWDLRRRVDLIIE
jgi:hypothetical protein